jgi:hypothetical protein
MQMQHRPVFARCGPIDGVAEDGPIHRGAMDAKLMRASGQRFEREPGKIPSPLAGEGGEGGW